MGSSGRTPNAAVRTSCSAAAGGSSASDGDVAAGSAHPELELALRLALQVARLPAVVLEQHAAQALLLLFLLLRIADELEPAVVLVHGQDVRRVLQRERAVA